MDHAPGTASVERALRVLYAFNATRTDLTLADLATITKLDKATLLRYIRVLQGFRLIERNDDRYSLGLGAFELGATYLVHLDLHRMSRPVMEELATDLTETISLAIRDAGEVVYIEIARGQAEIGIQSQIGARQQAHCTSLGKVLIAWLSVDERDRHVYSQTLHKLTSKTIVDRDQLEKHLEQVRRQGFATDDEERLEGIRCVAAPIRDRTGIVVAAISVSGAAVRMTPEKLRVAQIEVVKATRDISLRLGAEAGRASAVDVAGE